MKERSQANDWPATSYEMLSLVARMLSFTISRADVKDSEQHDMTDVTDIRNMSKKNRLS